MHSLCVIGLLTSISRKFSGAPYISSAVCGRTAVLERSADGERSLDGAALMNGFVDGELGVLVDVMTVTKQAITV